MTAIYPRDEAHFMFTVPLNLAVQSLFFFVNTGIKGNNIMSKEASQYPNKHESNEPTKQQHLAVDQSGACD